MVVWQKGRSLVRLIYEITSRQVVARDAGLCNQARRAGVSIVLNIAEGFERNGNKEFVHFLYIAKGSSGELRALSYLLFDLKYITEEEFEIVKTKTGEISRMITGFIKYLRSTEIKGAKFKMNEKQKAS